MHPGDVVQSRFRIEYRVAAGGMGQIYRATDMASGDTVAMKVMLHDDSEQAHRFLREAKVLSKLRHPRIVHYVADGVTDSGKPYLVMEWLSGEDLALRLRRGALEMSDALTVVSHVADALVVAHANGIIHRDVKPSNIFLVHGNIDQIKLLDFGLARLPDASPLTRAGTMVGTPGYMAPEQVQNDRFIDARVDVFALGCVLMECLTGAPVFMAEHVMAVLAKILLQNPPRLRELRPDLPQWLDSLVAQMLSKDPGRRPRDGAAVASALATLETNAGEDIQIALQHQVSLTGAEQRVLSLVLIGKEAPADSAPTLAHSITLASHADLKPAVGMYEAALVPLVDGSALVTFEENGIDVPARAARNALAIRSIVPDRPIVLSTGRGEVKGKIPVGAVIDRAAAMLLQDKPAEPFGARPIIIDETSAHLLDGRFDIRETEGSFTLCGLRDPVTRTRLGNSTTFVGRDVEIRIMEEHWRSCLEDSTPGVILVTGAAGTGKSRLLHEFLCIARGIAPHLSVWMGRGDALTAGSALSLLGDALRGPCGVAEGGPLKDRHRKIHEQVARHANAGDAIRIAEFLGELVGAPFPSTAGSPLQAARHDARLMSEHRRRAFEDFLDAESAAQPVVLVLEDLHWGDLPTVRFVDAALRNLRNRSFLVVALARPEVEERFPKLWHERAVQKVRLRPLSPKASGQIVVQALGDAVNSELKQRIITLADGNVFYLEELLRAASEAKNTTMWKPIDLPETVLAMVHARLESLPAEARRTLRAASIFGEIFFRGGLAALLGRAAESPTFDVILDDLVAREVIQRRLQSRFSGETEYMFRHALVREGAYAMLTEMDKKLGHRLAGTWLERQGEPDAMLLAHHFEQGDDNMHAANAYCRAAAHALEADDLDAAIERAERGVVCGAHGEELGTLRLIQAEAHNWRGELSRSVQCANEAIELLVPGTMAWLRAMQQAADASGKLGEFDGIERYGELLKSATPAPDATSARVMCFSVCANHLIYEGRYAAADAVISALEETMEQASLSAQAAGMYHQMRAIRASASCDPCGLRDNLQIALVFFEQAGDRRSVCLTRQNLGFGLVELGDYEGAERALRLALRTAERMGLHEVVTAAQQNLGHVLGYRGMYEEGRRVQLQAIEAAHERGHLRLKGLSQIYLAELEFAFGDLDAAVQIARAAIDSLAGVPPLRAAALAVLARVLLARGHAADSLAVAREAYEILELFGAIEEGEALVRLAYAEALAANGHAEEFTRVIALAQEQVLGKAAKINDPAERQQFLTRISDNARTLALGHGVLE